MNDILKRTNVLIVGGGPAGMLLAHVLGQNGIETIVLERRSRDYVLSRVRGGGLEWCTADFLRSVGLGKRMDSMWLPHGTLNIAYGDSERIYMDMKKLTGKEMIIYGQKFVTQDLYAARDLIHGETIHEVEDVKLHSLECERPFATFSKDGKNYRIDCDYVAGCDGGHGVSRQSIPESKIKFFEKIFPFAWLGIVAEVEPCPEVFFVYHEKGFALVSKRGPNTARNFIQCGREDSLEDWPDERLWAEFKSRLPADIADQVQTGPIQEKVIAPLRSYVTEPMQYGRLFLAGDAAHTVPPTSAKGLNLAVSDIFYLSRGFVELYKNNNSRYLEAYSETALKRVWGAVRFSNFTTELLHVYPKDTPFELRLKEDFFRYLAKSPSAQQFWTEQYVGLPYS